MSMCTRERGRAMLEAAGLGWRPSGLQAYVSLTVSYYLLQYQSTQRKSSLVVPRYMEPGAASYSVVQASISSGHPSMQRRPTLT